MSKKMSELITNRWNKWLSSRKKIQIKRFLKSFFLSIFRAVLIIGISYLILQHLFFDRVLACYQFLFC